MLKTILTFCLLAFSTAQAATITLGPGGDIAHLEDITGQISSGDVIEVTASYNDSSSTYENLTAIDNVTWDLNGYTITFTDATLQYTAGLGENWTIKDGTFKYPRNIALSSAGVYRMENLNFIGKLVSGLSTSLIKCDSSFDSLLMTDCSFAVEDTISQYLSWIYMSVDGYVSVTDSDFTSAGYAFRAYGVKSTKGIIFDGCSFSDQDNIGVEFLLGGNPTISDCSFSTSVSDTEQGLYFRGGTSGTNGAVITGCTFNDAACYVGTPYNETQGDSITVSNNTFTGTNISTILTVRINYANIYGNTFYGTNGSGWGTPTNGPHIVAIGNDGGYDVGEDNAAYGVLFHDNTFAIAKAPSHGTPLAYYPLVVKAKGASVYNNKFEYAVDLDGGVTTPTFVHPKGATNLSVHNNDFICNDENISVILFNVQGSSLTRDIGVYNNKITGTYENLAYFMADGLDTNFVFDNNYYNGNALADSSGVVVDATESPWYGSANFTDATSWRMEFGGKAGLTGVTAMPSGFVTIGAIQRSTDPVISVNQPGFETPVEAFLRCRDMGLTGVELDWYIHGDGAADALNMDNWLNGTGATGDGTTSGSTWEAQAFDTLRVGKVK